MRRKGKKLRQSVKKWRGRKRKITKRNKRMKQRERKRSLRINQDNNHSRKNKELRKEKI
jgi:hypothetical protein